MAESEADGVSDLRLNGCFDLSELQPFPPAHLGVELERDRIPVCEYQLLNYLPGHHNHSLLVFLQRRVTGENTDCASILARRYIDRFLRAALAEGPGDAV